MDSECVCVRRFYPDLQLAKSYHAKKEKDICSFHWIVQWLNIKVFSIVISIWKWKRTVGLASSLFGLKQQQKTLPSIWFLVNRPSNEMKTKLVFVLVKFWTISNCVPITTYFQSAYHSVILCKFLQVIFGSPNQIFFASVIKRWELITHKTLNVS